MLSQLIEALNIFLKYGDPAYPTHCEHDCLIICGIQPDDVSKGDKDKLEELGFSVDNEYGDPHFMSSKYGSA